MRVNQEPLSAFALYSERLKQKKKSKPVKKVVISKSKTGNPIRKKKQQKINKEADNQKRMEIELVLKSLAEQSEAENQDLAESALNTKSQLKGSHTIKEFKNNESNISNGQSNDIESQIKIRSKSVYAQSLEHLFDFNDDNRPEKTSCNDITNLVSKSNSMSDSQIQERQNCSIKSSTPIGKDHSKSKTKQELKLKNKSFELQDGKMRKGLQRRANMFEIANPKHDVGKKDVLEKNQNKNSFSKNNDTNKVLEVTFINTAGPTPKSHKSVKYCNSESTRPTRKRNTRRPKSKAKGTSWTNQENSVETSKRLFNWLTLPVGAQEFMRDYWEKQPLLIQREYKRNHYSELLSTPQIDSILRENHLYFTKHLDVTSYSDGVRETHNLSGRAQANVVWDFYSNGCSVRMLNPQAFVPRIHALNASLQEFFCCFVGANVYLTPPNSQGFAPHYDDIEAFVLQIEGKKHWKVYAPRNAKETLPRYSSPNFTEDEIGQPFLDVILEPGDMLYFPRGFIHQASTVEGEHSLHITLSAYQKTAWIDLLEKTLPIALKRAAEEDVDFRRGLPINYLNLEFNEMSGQKKRLMNTASHLMSKLNHFLGLSLGHGVDLMGAQFMHDALPPVFTPEEKLNSGLGGGLKMGKNGVLENRVELDMNTKVKLIRANICRIVEQESEVRLYHCLDNPLEYHAEDPQFLVLPQEGVSVITTLFCKYPEFVNISSLPHQDEEALLTLVSDLWEAGFLAAKDLQTVNEEKEQTGDEEGEKTVDEVGEQTGNEVGEQTGSECIEENARECEEETVHKKQKLFIIK